jgi:hypothetical protein
MKDPNLLVGVSDNAANKCYRFKRGEKGKAYYFSYAGTDTREQARDKANAFAREFRKKHGPPVPTCVKGKMTKSNRSGKPGVFPKHKQGRTKDQIFWYWAACWPKMKGGAPAFSVLAHGDTGAFVRASIACDLETKDRDLVEASYREYQRSGEMARFLAAKKLELPEA